MEICVGFIAGGTSNPKSRVMVNTIGVCFWIVLMTPVTYHKKLTGKGIKFSFFKNRVGQCGAWSFDTFEEICYLHIAYSCCGQFDKQESDSNFISGYTCNQCWSTRNDCPCGKKNPLPYEPNLPNYPSQPTVEY